MPKNTRGARKHPKTARQQNTRQSDSPPAVHTRMQTRMSMTTEYQDRFRPLCSIKVTVSSSSRKNSPTSNDITCVRSFYGTDTWMKKPSKVPQPPEPPKNYSRSRRSALNAADFSANQRPPKVDYNTVYRSDFKHWEISKRKPFVMEDNLTNHRLANTAMSKPASQKQKQRPIECITTYRLDYVPHPTQPRPVRMKQSNQSSTDLPLEPRLHYRPKVAQSTQQDIADSEFLQQFNRWSLETNFNSRTKDSPPPAANNIHCEVNMQNLPTSKETGRPVQAMTTMMEDYRVWDAPQRFTAVTTAFSVGKPNSTSNHKASPPKINKTAVCDSSQDATQKPQYPAETGGLSGFKCSPGNRNCTMSWSNNLDGGGPWPEGKD